MEDDTCYKADNGKTIYFFFTIAFSLNIKFRKGISHFYFLNIGISLGISGTFMNILEHTEEHVKVVVTCVSDL